MNDSRAAEGPASRRTAVRTLPEQIADDLGAAIARGKFAGGDRLLEQDIATRYGVSRGPVREALRILTQRGLAVLYPRRGAFVVEISLDTLVDLFNMRAVLMGLAARYFAVLAADEVRGELKSALEQLRLASKSEHTDPVSFISCTSRISVLISRNCGSQALSVLIDHQNEYSAWGSLWQSGRIDFATKGRRLAGTGDYISLGEAIEGRDGARAEAMMRHMIMTSRENAVAALAEVRGETYDSRRLLSA